MSLVEQLHELSPHQTTVERAELIIAAAVRIDKLERALFDVRHSVLNEVTFATHPQSIILSAILKRIGEALECK